MPLDCCVATLEPPYARHAVDCRLYPGRRIMRVGSSERGQASSPEFEPKVPSTREMVWLSHDVACQCADCRYVDAHLDDEPA